MRWRATLFTFGLALLTSRGVSLADEAVALDLSSQLATQFTLRLSIEPGELAVPTRPAAGGLFWQSDDGLRSASAPGHALLAAPFVGAASLIADGALHERLDPLFAPGDRTVEQVLLPLRRDPRVLAFALFGALCAAAITFFTLSALRARGGSARVLAAGALLLVASPLAVYAGSTWSQLPATAALALALFCATRKSAHGLDVGAALALAVLVRAELVLALPGVALAPPRPRAALGALVPPLAAFALDAALVPASSAGFSWSTLPEGALGLLASPGEGLCVHAPWVVLALASLDRRWLLAALPLFALYAGWFDWASSLAYGPRLLLPLVPALALVCAPVAAARPRLAATLVLFAIIMAIPGVLAAHARLGEPDPWSLEVFGAWARLHPGDLLAASQPAWAAAALVALALSALPWRGRAAEPASI